MTAKWYPMFKNFVFLSFLLALIASVGRSVPLLAVWLFEVTGPSPSGRIRGPPLAVPGSAAFALLLRQLGSMQWLDGVGQLLESDQILSVFTPGDSGKGWTPGRFCGRGRSMWGPEAPS